MAMTITTGDRKRALEAALSQIERSFGKGSIMRLGDATVFEIEVIPTGSLGLDHALGVWGIPRGRVTEVFGPESSGKTTLASIHFESSLGMMLKFIRLAMPAVQSSSAMDNAITCPGLLSDQRSDGRYARSTAKFKNRVARTFSQ